MLEMSKYIIKNCPAFLDDVQLLEFSEGTCNSLQNHRTYCQDCTDCVMKQIYDLCNHYKDVDIVALQVTKLLQIEEVD